MKRKLILIVFVLVTISGIAFQSYMQTNERNVLPLARFMPRGALAYAEFADAGDLLRRWESAPARERYFESVNWKQFQESRLYLKWRDRIKPVEVGLGIEITEDQFAKFVGTRSALAVYNIGELEAVFITEMSRSQGLSAVLFEQSADFKERSADGQLYYVREGADDEGRRKVTVGFAFADGKLFVASNETLLRRALTNLKDTSDDRLRLQIAPLVESLDGFRPHELTVWLDQQRLNRDIYFANYWIHRNRADLETIESALVDLEITGNEFCERRWFALKDGAQANQRVIGSLAETLRFAPADSPVLTVSPSSDPKTLSRMVAEVLVGEVSPPRRTTVDVWRGSSSAADESESSSEYESASDDRFNKEIDDPTSFTGSHSGGARQPDVHSDGEDKFVARLATLLQPAGPQEVMNVGGAALGENKFFVTFNRALVIRLARPDAFAPSELENALREEFAARYAVGVNAERFTWNVSGEVHSLGQPLVERGGAYAVVGPYLILANRADYCAQLVGAYKESRSSSRTEQPRLKRFAQVRVPPGKGTYKHVMGILAVPTAAFGSNEVIDVFRDNLAGLVEVVPALSGVTIETVQAGRFIIELAVYQF